VSPQFEILIALICKRLAAIHRAIQMIVFPWPLYVFAGIGIFQQPENKTKTQRKSSRSNPFAVINLSSPGILRTKKANYLVTAQPGQYRAP